MNANGVCDEVEIPGCMDTAACLYDDDATIDDGSCDYTSCAGCTDPTACNYDPGATIDDGQCTHPEDSYPDFVVDGEAVVDCVGRCNNDADNDDICDELEIPGCQDTQACNFNPEATDDDGSCFNAAEGYDCDGNCLEDTDGDGVCNPFEIDGCTDAAACNYDSAATDEDGSCTYPAQDYLDCDGNCLNDSDEDGTCDELEPACPGDLNGDGLRGAADILLLLSSFGCTEGCGDPDLNGDGLVAANDILLALSTFGMACPQ